MGAIPETSKKMIGIILCLIFVVASSACNAMMDTLVHHWYKFRWADKVNNWKWEATISWLNKYVDKDPKKGRRKWLFGLNYPVVLSDAWHFFKMWQIIFICCAIVSSYFSAQIRIFDSILLDGLVYVIALGIVWNKTFSLFYDIILVKPTE